MQILFRSTLARRLYVSWKFGGQIIAVGCLSVVLVACHPTEDAQVSEVASVSVLVSDAADDGKGPRTVSAVQSNEVGAAGHDTSVVVELSTINPLVSSELPAARFATAGLIAETAQRPGNAAAGKRALLEEAYVSCGLPERVFRQLLEAEAVVEMPDRQSASQDLPYNVNLVESDGGSNIVSNNCLTCHAVPMFGKLVVGLGNEFLDFTRDASAMVERAGALVDGAEETAVWEFYADRMAVIAPYIRPHTVGVNPANNLTAALIAHRRAEDNAWSEDPLLALPPTDPPPVSVPPWWRMQKKPAMFNLGEGRMDHARLMMAASMLCTDSLHELEQIDEYAPDIRAFIASLQPPQWPFDSVRQLAEQGRIVFEANCSACHGTYGVQPAYPSRLVPLEIIQTDATLVEFAHGDGVIYNDWFNRSFYGRTALAAPGPGYVAPPLDGIWATAPFLHNGSVPSIRALLDSATRPTYWRHLAADASDPASYDQQNLGWAYETLTAGKANRRIPERVYDTTLPGYANTGHQFGDRLSDEQRSAVLEYLKTL